MATFGQWASSAALSTGDYLYNSTKNVDARTNVVNQNVRREIAPFDREHHLTPFNSRHPEDTLRRLARARCHWRLARTLQERGPHAPKCHPETRVAVRKEIFRWIRHDDQHSIPQRILWLQAIAGAIADECHKDGSLAASFFFSAYSGSINRRSKQPFILTLAYGLLQQRTIVGLKDAILSVIEEDPTVLKKHLDRQLDELILGPLRAVAEKSDHATWPRIIIVDGVDECEGDKDNDGSKQDIRRFSPFWRAPLGDPSFPFRILMASRPEPAITEFFKAAETPVLTLQLFLDDKYDPDADIRQFLEVKLREIQRKYYLPDGWAPHDAIDRLVHSASGQFIYVATALRVVEDSSLPPQAQLTTVDASGPNPLASLDALYTAILETSPDPFLAGKWLVCFNTPWEWQSTYRSMAHTPTRHDDAPTWFKQAVLESFPVETVYLLGGLSSLISLTVTGDDGKFSIGFYHKSLLDFLQDERRSGSRCVSGADAVQLIKDRHYYVLKNRGPQGSMSNLDMAAFYSIFCNSLPTFSNPSLQYEPEDIAWWLRHVNASRWARKDRYLIAMCMFISIDMELWRKAILRHCKEASWQYVPTRLDLLWNELHKLKLGIRKQESTIDGSNLWLCFRPPAATTVDT
ncbi:hypothetical protein FA13DRAFT_1730315 [Coprinellus micaceus]|uniref:Nephrocystin 3-like N-terminal domain-containing protein n=1 Tax=Coprinellus micaceus TaxID=71717 RepID=A0A4Y7TIK4_COPMI|nr:hypothetical protein FA13DRAFT_1730315 [Coprinellus micaceus]